MVSLRYLSLPSTELEGGIPNFFGNSCSLNLLRLPFNYLNGQLSELIQSLSGGCMVNSLESLYLGANDLTGPIHDFGGFSSLKELRLRENRLNGTINKSLGQLSKLESLSLGRNSFTGVISETFFNNMFNLQIPTWADNSLDFEIEPWLGSSFSSENIKSCLLQDGTSFSKMASNSKSTYFPWCLQ